MTMPAYCPPHPAWASDPGVALISTGSAPAGLGLNWPHRLLAVWTWEGPPSFPSPFSLYLEAAITEHVVRLHRPSSRPWGTAASCSYLHHVSGHSGVSSAQGKLKGSSRRQARRDTHREKVRWEVSEEVGGDFQPTPKAHSHFSSPRRFYTHWPQMSRQM